VLVCRKTGDLVELDFPATPVTSADASAELCEALGVTASFVGASRFDRLVLVNSEGLVRALQPDFSRLRELPVRGGIVRVRVAGDRVYLSGPAVTVFSGLLVKPS